MRRGRVSASLALFVATGVAAQAIAVPDLGDGVATPRALSEDDECDAEAGSARCGINALQLRSVSLRDRADAAPEAMAQQAAGRIWHYALNCYQHCGQTAGYCSSYCGPGNACCRYLSSADPPECHTVRFWPVTMMHTCVTPHMQQPAPDTTESSTAAPVDESYTPSPSPSPSATEGGAPAPPPLIFTNPKLFRPSDAPVMKFYVYRAQSDENYAPENQNVGNLAGILWYMHNEIVWHPHLQRSGTYFSTSKTRIEKFRVMVRATQSLYDLGMNFAVVNAFDSTKCTGPYHCKNFAEYGYAVGCETWEKGSGSDFPHGQWDNTNKYPSATWYSLPGPCSSRGLDEKTRECVISEPGGSCVMGGIPTGAGDCTYTYEKVGEIPISELEGITDEEQFKTMGGLEYDKTKDKGYLNDFWNDKFSEDACRTRVEKAEELFKTKFPDLEHLPDPVCNFNKWKFEQGLRTR